MCFKIASALTLSGLRTGLFVSPHISSFRERVLISCPSSGELDDGGYGGEGLKDAPANLGSLMSTDAVCDLLPSVFAACKSRSIPATFFEITTALALQHFHRQDVDCIVLETGLGGRLDATNVVDPSLSVVTSIGLEHTRILGDTVEEIGREKAGIFKPSRPALVGPDVPWDTMSTVAGEVGVASISKVEDVLGVDLSGSGDDFDKVNSAIALAALKLLRDTPDFAALPIPDSAMSRGILALPPCRFQPHITPTSVPCILDAAHNPSALSHLRSKLRADRPGEKLRVVFACSSDKDIAACGDIVSDMVEGDTSRVSLCVAQHPRAASVEELRGASRVFEGAEGYDTVKGAVDGAVAKAGVEGETVVICGTLFIMADVREALGMEQVRDSDFLEREAGAGIRKGEQER